MAAAGTIAAAICNYFGFRGGSHAIDSACSSSTQAVASACTALAAGEIDVAIAGGVDISIDPLELIGLAKAGVLATDGVRIYDEEPGGYLPAEGCGVVVLMRTADARAADLPVYAEITGWGTSATSHAEQDERRVSSQLLAMQRAYERAGLDPREIQLFEGNGAGTREDDDAELAALGVLRQGAQAPAVLGSVKANIGHAKAAAGIASLIKTVLAVSNGVLPPATGVRRPHPMITEGDAQLTLPQITQEWPEGVRHAAVSTLNVAGANVHLVVRGGQAGRPRQDRGWRSRLMPARSLDPHDPVVPRLMADAGEPMPFLLQAPDRFALAAVLNRLAAIARWLSDAEMQDLACSLGRDPGASGPCRVALVATGQEQLGSLAATAASMLPDLAGGLLTVVPGIFAAQDADGRITLLLSDTRQDPAAAEPLTGAVSGCLEALRWLESLDVQAAAAVGHGMGALAGLAWAGVLGQDEVIEIADLRAKFLHRSAAAAGAVRPGEPGSLAASQPRGRADAGRAGQARPPRRRHRAARGYRPEVPVRAATAAADLDVHRSRDRLRRRRHRPDLQRFRRRRARSRRHQRGRGRGHATGGDRARYRARRLGGREYRGPAVSLAAGTSDPAGSAAAVAALFAAGALGQPQAFFAGRPGRAIDIWRERTFIVGPCETRPQIGGATPRPGTAVVPEQAAPADADTPAGEAAARRRRHRADGDIHRSHCANGGRNRTGRSGRGRFPRGQRHRIPAEATAPAEAPATDAAHGGSRRDDRDRGGQRHRTRRSDRASRGRPHAEVTRRADVAALIAEVDAALGPMTQRPQPRQCASAGLHRVSRRHRAASRRGRSQPPMPSPAAPDAASTTAAGAADGTAPGPDAASPAAGLARRTGEPRRRDRRARRRCGRGHGRDAAPPRSPSELSRPARSPRRATPPAAVDTSHRRRRRGRRGDRPIRRARRVWPTCGPSSSGNCPHCWPTRSPGRGRGRAATPRSSARRCTRRPAANRCAGGCTSPGTSARLAAARSVFRSDCERQAHARDHRRPG